MSNQEPKPALSTRTLSVHQGILYGIGCGIGGSIFILLGPAIEIAGHTYGHRQDEKTRPA